MEAMEVQKKMMKRNTIRTYSELIKLLTFEERYEYLKLGGTVAEDTFGFDRYLNQILYQLPEWKSARNKAIIRDNGCDLGCPDREIKSQKILVHHINPITKEDILNRNSCLFNLENLITTTLDTHNAIHYGDSGLLPKEPIERTKYDTCPWRH